MVTNTYNPNSPGVLDRGLLQVCSQPGLHSEFKASLGYRDWKEKNREKKAEEKMKWTVGSP